MQLVCRLAAGLMILAVMLAAGPTLAASPAGSGAAGATVTLARASEGVALPAEPVLGQPRNWEIGLQPGYSPVKRDMIALNDLVLWIIIGITLFVGALLVWVMVRYNAKRNPVPTQNVHNTALEIAWTIVPVLILVVIAIPSFRLVYFENRTADPAMTIKVTGHQWYWEYTYPGKKNLDFISSIVPGDKLKRNEPRLLTANNPLVLPAGENIRILITSSDVIHSFFIPSLGVQRYAIPGRTIETWVRIDRPGIYYGECNQICGVNHSRMPIDVVAVTPAQFQAWATGAEKQMADNATPASPAIHPAAARQLAEATPVPAAQLFAQAQESRH
ncbi:MAG: cytochrome c oxidase subunit II [Rhodospirillales bacterium]|nr:cytochrome c oxidase subunit II [Rhodospirillales bacterium]